jgi:hypothetical protein
MGLLREQLRPVVTFNRIGPFIDSVAGHEINNRTETRYIPRQVGATGVADLETSAAKWVRDECDADDEETQAFIDLVVCGLGWSDTRPDYDTDPDGEIVISRVDPVEMWPDPAARQANLGDMQYCFRVKQVSSDTAKAQFPGYDLHDLDAQWARGYMGGEKQPHDALEAPFYRNDQSGNEDQQRQKITMVEVQWWEYETSYRVADPATGNLIRIDGDQYKLLRDRVKTMQQAGIPMRKVEAAKDRRKCYYKAVLGNIVLESGKGPGEGGFTWKCMTGKRDRNKGTWYGIVRGMKDPQRWANKWLSQTMQIINTNAKGGLIAEEGAFPNPREAADTWADPSAITFVNKGVLAQGQIKDKPAITYPQGMDALMEFAVSSIPATTGINPEMLGQTTSMQPGVAVAEVGRRQQAMAILAGLFNAKRRYMKEQGRLLLWMIQTFISDGRLIRIGGPENAQYVPLVKNPEVNRYDIIVDDTPTSPNMKERTFGILMQMMPALQNMAIPPQVWLEILKYSPLPETLVGKITKMMDQQAQQQPHADPVAAAVAQSEQAKAQAHMADAQKTQAEAAMLPQKLQLEAQKYAAEIEATRSTAIANLAKAGVAHRGAALDEATAAVDALLAAHQQDYDQKLAAHQQAHDQKMDIQAANQPNPASSGA